jgi:hypothetical protein
MGIIVRNEIEEKFVKNIRLAHEFLNNKLNLDTNLDIERVCYWGKDAFHSGTYQQSKDIVCLNFRNLYGFDFKTLLVVLGHEFRHALQANNGWITTSKYSVKRNSNGRIESGTWKGKHISWTKYKDLPWEIDARKYENQYAEMVVKEKIISKKDLSIHLTGNKTYKPLVDETIYDFYAKNKDQNVQIFTSYIDTEQEAKKVYDEKRNNLVKQLNKFDVYIENKKLTPVPIKYKEQVYKILDNLKKLRIKRTKNKDGFCYLSLKQLNQHETNPNFKSWNRNAVDFAFNNYESQMQKQFVPYKKVKLTIRDLTS